jgi:hypothetical protein
MTLPLILLLLPSPSRAAVPLVTAPQAPIYVNSVLPAAVIPFTLSSPLIPLPLMPSPLSLTPTALQAVPLIAGAVDSKAPVEAAAAGGEKLTALLQGANPLSRVKVVEVIPGVLHMTFPSQHLMASTFVRFQEHYESPKFRGKVFTRAEFDAWYNSRPRPGDVSYYKYWDGFNIPSRVLARFKKGDFDPLSSKEQALLARVAARKDPFYLIGTSGKGRGNPFVFRHEVAHGLWYTRPDYRRRAQALLRGVDLKPVFKMLERLSYHESVWLDEAHAWLGDRAQDIRNEGLNPKPYAAVRKRLLALQKEYASGLF